MLTPIGSHPRSPRSWPRRPATTHPAAAVLRGPCLALLILLLALGLLQPAGVAATVGLPTPTAVTTEHLVEASFCGSELPPTVEMLTLARVTLAAGATASVAHGGHLFIVESGALTVGTVLRAYVSAPGTPGPVHTEVPAGPPVTYGPGDQFVVTDDVAAQTTIVNGESAAAVALVVSLVNTAGAGSEASLSGWTTVESIAVAEAGTVGPPLSPPGWSHSTAISVSLTRVAYERGAEQDIVGPVARLLAVETGAVNVRVGGPAWYAPADADAQELPATARVSLTPGDALLMAGPDRIETRNVARGPSTLLIVTVSQIYSFAPLAC